jgi:hypothetical protein
MPCMGHSRARERGGERGRERRESARERQRGGEEVERKLCNICRSVRGARSELAAWMQRRRARRGLRGASVKRRREGVSE